MLARRVVLFALLLERGHLDGHTTIVDSQSNGGINLAFAIVVGLGWVLGLGRLTFLELDRANGASFDRAVQFVLVILGAHNCDAGRVAAGQLDTRDELTLGAVLVLVIDLASLLQGEGFPGGSAARAGRGGCVGPDGVGTIQVLAVSADADLLEGADRARLRTGLGRAARGTTGSAALAGAGVGG